VSEEELRRYDRCARLAEVDRSTWIRTRLKAAADREEKAAGKP
jgi:hypothetical protein